MSKERLEEIKSREREVDYLLGGTRFREDLDWLIKQAERVQELEKQNKRYREALEKISAPIYKVAYADMVAVKRIARQALEGEK